MASSSTPHYFLPGRKSKNEGPGILVVHGMYKFRLNKSNKEKTKFIMYCVQQNNPEFRCKARAIVTKSEDNFFSLYSCNDNHSQLVNKAEVTDEELHAILRKSVISV